MQEIYILSIESSCDETAMAIINSSGVIIANIVSSQIKIHTSNGGVVPELASRLHLENIDIVFNQCLAEAKLEINDIDYISVVNRPGLVGALHVGVIFAKSISYLYNIPILPVDHIAAHIYAATIDNELDFPCLALVASGGHTQLILMHKHLDFKVIGTTLDDAVGECYDKVARVLKIGYPGGPILDEKAMLGKDIYNFPTPMDDQSYNFSYSGLKSNVINKINQLEMKKESYLVEDIACSFQTKAIDILIKKSLKAINEFKTKTFIIAGGVSANSYLRQQLINNDTFNNIKLIMPDLKYCGDNGPMVAALSYYYPKSRFKIDYDFGIKPNSKIEDI